MEESVFVDLAETNFSSDGAIDEHDAQDVVFWPKLLNNISIKGLIPFGIVMNVVFLFIVMRVRAMHTTINIYLCNLAVADMLFLSVMAYFYTNTTRNFGTSVVTYVPYFASMFFVTTVAAGRCFATYFPFRARAGATKCQAAKIAAAVWVVGILSSVGFNLLSYYELVDTFAMDVLYLSINPVFLLVNVVLYAAVIYGLCRSICTTATSINQRRMAVMLVTNTAVFFTFHIAATSFNLHTMFNIDTPMSTLTTAYALINMLLFLNSGINPLVYGATNADYRKALIPAFRWQCKKESSTKTQSNYIELNVQNQSTS